MPISEKQLAANRANAKKSTGPKSPRRPKSETWKNLAKTVLLPGESHARFRKLTCSLEAQYQPKNINEQLLVADIAIARWRVARSWALDTASLAWEYHKQNPPEAHEHPATRAMLAFRALADNSRQPALMSSREAQYERSYHRALHRLEKLRAPKQNPPNDPAQPNETKGNLR